jgi:hypothetical protein
MASVLPDQIAMALALRDDLDPFRPPLQLFKSGDIRFAKSRREGSGFLGTSELALSRLHFGSPQPLYHAASRNSYFIEVGRGGTSAVQAAGMGLHCNQ